jgi:hypothetical protein
MCEIQNIWWKEYVSPPWETMLTKKKFKEGSQSWQKKTIRRGDNVDKKNYVRRGDNVCINGGGSNPVEGRTKFDSTKI